MINNNESQPKFNQTIMVGVLVLGIWFLWQKYLENKYPNVSVPSIETSQVKSASPESTATKANVDISSAKFAVDAITQTVQEEKTIIFEDENLRAEISNVGMGLKSIVLKKYQDREKKNIEFVSDGKINNFTTGYNGNFKAIYFTVTQNGSEFKGEFVDPVNGLKIVKKMTFDTQKLNIVNTVNVTDINNAFFSLENYFSSPKHKPASHSFLFPSTEVQEVVYKSEKGFEHKNTTALKEAYNEKFDKTSISAISDHYFTLAYVDKSDIFPKTQFTSDVAPDTFVTSTVSYKPETKNQMYNFEYINYVGPKDIEMLKQTNSELVNLINYGMFGSIARVLLAILKWFNHITSNWGVAIILLTILVRIIVLPLHLMSFKSMKAMQKIQPILNQVKEKYKDNPQELNKATMALWKEHKINPFGGCLPMLLQLPVFFALYQVFGQSIELYRAPFFGWIMDLSLKDPFYILPILMAVSMFVQQKLTPTTMDPVQQKVFMFLPLVFSLFMLSLPSGLTLYMFINSTFGIIQQYLLMRDQSVVNIKAVKA